MKPFTYERAADPVAAARAVSENPGAKFMAGGTNLLDLMKGGMIMGAGSGLTEESILDPRHGQFVNHDLAEYHVPVQADIPAVEVLILPEREEKANPLGTKGIGEIGIVGVAAAIANAVFNATGVRVREAPVTLDKVLVGLPG